VPNVAGSPADRAAGVIAAAGMTAGSRSEAWSPTVPAGSVVSTNPPAGTQVRLKTKVDLVVSKGPEPIKVPDVVGQNEQKAMDTLSKAGLVGKVGERVFSDQPIGEVLKQDPAGATTQPRGSTVTLTVSKGPDLVVVPDVRGMSRSGATQTLKAAGLEIRVRVDVPFGSDSVIQQSPNGGTKIKRGSRVSVWLF
jgi:serine/threonine-protein kinase